MLLLFAFFKQMPAYDMRIRDGSSDVCPSDRARRPASNCSRVHLLRSSEMPPRLHSLAATRSEERRAGIECVSTCGSRWSPDHYNQKPRIGDVHIERAAPIHNIRHSQRSNRSATPEYIEISRIYNSSIY